MEIKEAIRRIEEHKRVHFSREPRAVLITEALDLAIEALQRQIPRKVVVEKWSPSRCPACGTCLSDHVDDGYYKHLTHLKVCPNAECCQRLEW